MVQLYDIIAMRKVNLLTLEEEYWYALSDCFASYGFKSRQEMMEVMIVDWVKNNAPEALEMGVAKMKFLASGKAVRERVELPPLMVRSRSQMYTRQFTPMKFYFRDGRVEYVEAPSVMEGFLMIEMEDGLGEKEFKERVLRIEYTEAKNEEKH